MNYTGVRIINKLYAKINYIKHQQNLEQINSKAAHKQNCNSCFEFPKLKKLSKQYINCSNSRINSSIKSIRSQFSKRSSQNSFIKKSNNIQMRLGRLKNIQDENIKMTKRIINAKSNYLINQYQKDFQRHNQLKKRFTLQNSNEMAHVDSILMKLTINVNKSKNKKYSNSQTKNQNH